MKEQDAAHSFETTEWEKEEPKANGKYLVKVMICDVPYEECEDVDEFKNGYWLRYAQFVIGWRPMPKNYKNEDEILAQQNAFHLVKALDLIDECYHYMKANPPDKTKMSYSKWQSLVEETNYMREFNSSAEHVRNNEDSELTRLRSELQTLQSALDHCKEVGIIREDLIAEQKSELQQERELKKELVECIESYIDLELFANPKPIESLIEKSRACNYPVEKENFEIMDWTDGEGGEPIGKALFLVFENKLNPNPI